MEEFDSRRLRGLLAEERITYTSFAAACGLSRAFLSHILAGRRLPGELARIKIARGLQRLGLDVEAHSAS